MDAKDIAVVRAIAQSVVNEHSGGGIVIIEGSDYGLTFDNDSIASPDIFSAIQTAIENGCCVMVRADSVTLGTRGNLALATGFQYDSNGTLTACCIVNCFRASVMLVLCGVLMKSVVDDTEVAKVSITLGQAPTMTI